jgi:hypothetical protein
LIALFDRFLGKNMAAVLAKSYCWTCLILLDFKLENMNGKAKQPRDRESWQLSRFCTTELAFGGGDRSLFP